ncbi:hypothetical protein B1757_04740 [Acidithiobacillus marinus]|uniref:Uncharacterized protein n=1 Tax=Acidithiobacillus marinus TaxID=187490 RepID=A0A2I1DNE6_9PROT|nr:hypothetical protein [Acidithiobacillus marinus]PKY11379.1 hypothetical protein B1757_04740 [Acidithiobacillus marinus]
MRESDNMDNHDKPMTAEDLLIDGKPSALQVKILRAISARKLDDNDPVLDVYNCTGMASEAAEAAGKAAKSVHEALPQIPHQIYQGATKAGKDISQVLRKAVYEETEQSGNTLKTIIEQSSNSGAEAIRSASDGLIGRLDRAIEQKKEEGVDQFAQAAATAAIQSVKSEVMQQMLLSFSGFTFLAALILAAGAGICWEYLHLSHLIAPSPILVTADSKPICGWAIVKGDSGHQYICAIQPPLPSSAA